MKPEIFFENYDGSASPGNQKNDQYRYMECSSDIEDQEGYSKCSEIEAIQPGGAWKMCYPVHISCTENNLGRYAFVLRLRGSKWSTH